MVNKLLVISDSIYSSIPFPFFLSSQDVPANPIVRAYTVNSFAGVMHSCSLKEHRLGRAFVEKTCYFKSSVEENVTIASNHEEREEFQLMIHSVCGFT